MVGGGSKTKYESMVWVFVVFVTLYNCVMDVSRIGDSNLMPAQPAQSVQPAQPSQLDSNCCEPYDSHGNFVCSQTTLAFSVTSNLQCY